MKNKSMKGSWRSFVRVPPSRDVRTVARRSTEADQARQHQTRAEPVPPKITSVLLGPGTRPHPAGCFISRHLRTIVARTSVRWYAHLNFNLLKRTLGGGVMSYCGFRRLPLYASKFLEMVLMLTADHGPAVSGVEHHYHYPCRQGLDISSLVAGLLTIGSRFGGALIRLPRSLQRLSTRGWAGPENSSTP